MNSENINEKEILENIKIKLQNKEDYSKEIDKLREVIGRYKMQSIIKYKQINEVINIPISEDDINNKKVDQILMQYKQIQYENEQKKEKLNDMKILQQQVSYIKKILELKIQFNTEGLSNKLSSLSQIINLRQVENNEKILNYVDQTIQELETILMGQFDVITPQNAALFLEQFQIDLLNDEILEQYLNLCLQKLIKEQNLYDPDLASALMEGQQKFTKFNSNYDRLCKNIIKIQTQRILLKTVENEKLENVIKVLDLFRLSELKQKIIQKISFQKEQDNYLQLVDLKDTFVNFLNQKIQFIELDHYLRINSPNQQNLEQSIPQKLIENSQKQQYIQFFYQLTFNFIEGFLEIFLDMKKEDQILMQNLLKTLSLNLMKLNDFGERQNLIIQCLQLEFKIVELIGNFDELIK